MGGCLGALQSLLGALEVTSSLVGGVGLFTQPMLQVIDLGSHAVDVPSSFSQAVCQCPFLLLGLGQLLLKSTAVGVSLLQLLLQLGNPAVCSSQGTSHVGFGILQRHGCIVYLGVLLTQLALQLRHPLALRFGVLGGVSQLPFQGLRLTLLVTEGHLEVLLVLLGPGQISLGRLPLTSGLGCLCSHALQLALEVGNPVAMGLHVPGSFSHLLHLCHHLSSLHVEGRLEAALALHGVCQVSFCTLQHTGDLLRLGSLVTKLPLKVGNRAGLARQFTISIDQVPVLVMEIPLEGLDGPGGISKVVPRRCEISP